MIEQHNLLNDEILWRNGTCRSDGNTLLLLHMCQNV